MFLLFFVFVFFTCSCAQLFRLGNGTKLRNTAFPAAFVPAWNLSVCAQDSVYLAVSQAHSVGHQIPPSLDRLWSLRAICKTRGHPPGPESIRAWGQKSCHMCLFLIFNYYFPQQWCPWDFDKSNLGCAPERLCNNVQLSAFVRLEAALPRPVLLGTWCAFQLLDGSLLVTLVVVSLDAMLMSQWALICAAAVEFCLNVF